VACLVHYRQLTHLYQLVRLRLTWCRLITSIGYYVWSALANVLSHITPSAIKRTETTAKLIYKLTFMQNYTFLLIHTFCIIRRLSCNPAGHMVHRHRVFNGEITGRILGGWLWNFKRFFAYYIAESIAKLITVSQFISEAVHKKPKFVRSVHNATSNQYHLRYRSPSVHIHSIAKCSLMSALSGVAN